MICTSKAPRARSLSPLRALLALGYLFLLQQVLERLRYRTDRGYADAGRLIADFQADVAWADLLLRTALWMREAPLELELCWRELAIVAKALADGRDMAEIGLMRDIAERTLAALANDERM